jgi:hypothetical protein
MVTVLCYISWFLGTISAVLLVVGATWYVIHHQPLFLVVQSRLIILNARFLALNLCILVLVALGYKFLLPRHR